MTRLKFDHALLRTLRQFRVRLKLHPKRRGVGMIYVPLPQHRIKGEFPGIQVIYAGVKARHDRTLQKRCEQEFESLFFHPERITAYQEAHITRVYEERANLDFR